MKRLPKQPAVQRLSSGNMQLSDEPLALLGGGGHSFVIFGTLQQLGERSAYRASTFEMGRPMVVDCDVGQCVKDEERKVLPEESVAHVSCSSVRCAEMKMNKAP